MIPAGFIALFSYKYVKYNHHIYSPPPSLLTLPSCPPLTGTVLPSCPLFFKLNVHRSKGFHCAIPDIIYCVLARLTPYHLLSLDCPAPPLFNTVQCIVLYYLHTQMKCISILFTLYHSPFLSPPPSSLRQTHYYKHIMYIFTHVHVYITHTYMSVWSHSVLMAQVLCLFILRRLVVSQTLELGLWELNLSHR
jgi:hypothetical protein